MDVDQSSILTQGGKISSPDGVENTMRAIGINTHTDAQAMSTSGSAHKGIYQTINLLI